MRGETEREEKKDLLSLIHFSNVYIREGPGLTEAESLERNPGLPHGWRPHGWRGAWAIICYLPGHAQEGRNWKQKQSWDPCANSCVKNLSREDSFFRTPQPQTLQLLFSFHMTFYSICILCCPDLTCEGGGPILWEEAHRGPWGWDGLVTDSLLAGSPESSTDKS